MQSRRVWLPAVTGVASFAAVVRPDLALADPDGEWGVAGDVEAILVGPEGGFTPDELAMLPRRVALGHHVLRVETAAVAAAMLLTHGHGPR
jgi:RsmE family RNA methyltransferase